MYLSGAPVNSLEWPKSTFDYKQASKPFHCFVFFYFSWFLPGSSSAVKTPRNALSALCWMCVSLQLLWKTQRWSSGIRKTTCKRTQQVTSNNVGICWSTMLRPFARSLRLKNYRKSQFKDGAVSIYSSVRISWFHCQKLSQLLGHSNIDLSIQSDKIIFAWFFLLTFAFLF